MIIALFTTIIAFLFSLFATLVISYVALLATPIGPWMETTLVLMGTIYGFNLLLIILPSKHKCVPSPSQRRLVALAVQLPWPVHFHSRLFIFWIKHFLIPGWPPLLFFAPTGTALVFAAGSFGFLIAGYLEKKLLADSTMVFPIGQMVYNMIAVQNELKKAYQLALGAALALGYEYYKHLPPCFRLAHPLAGALVEHIFPAAGDRRTDMIPMFGYWLYHRPCDRTALVGRSYCSACDD